MVVTHSKPANTADWPDLVQQLVDYTQRNLEEHPEPSWELVSHDMNIVDEELLVTFSSDDRSKPTTRLCLGSRR